MYPPALSDYSFSTFISLSADWRKSELQVHFWPCLWMNRSLVKLMSLSRRLDSMQNRVEEDVCTAGQSTEEHGGYWGGGEALWHWWKEGGGVVLGQFGGSRKRGRGACRSSRGRCIKIGGCREVGQPEWQQHSSCFDFLLFTWISKIPQLRNPSSFKGSLEPPKIMFWKFSKWVGGHCRFFGKIMVQVCKKESVICIICQM